MTEREGPYDNPDSTQLASAVEALRIQATELRLQGAGVSWRRYEATEVAAMLDALADRFGGQ